MSIRLAALSGFAALTSGAALAEVPDVAVDIAPVHSLVAQVMGDLGEPTMIVRRGASPHSYSMRPSEARALQEAEAIFWIGPELAPWLTDSIGNLAGEARTVELMNAPGTQALAFRTGANFAAHDHGHDDHDHAHEGEHEDHAHDEDGHQSDAHGGIDPHAWLDPQNAKAWLDVIATTLGDLDPDNAGTYSANADAAKSRLDATVAETEEALAPMADLRFVVFHDAYQYFETRFGLSAAGAIALADASDPSPARIEEVQALVRELDVTCVLAEPQFNQGLVRTVAEGTGASIGLIDPMGSVIEPGPDFYASLIRSVANEITDCGS